MKTQVTMKVGEHEISLETGRLAKQADGSVLVKCGNNMVLVTVCSDKEESGADFFPLTVEYVEKFYSTGKIPGGYFKREGRPSADQILTARVIDRPMRPMFPEGYAFETQIVATVLSADGQMPLDVLAGLGASTAVHISDIPFNGPVGFIEVGRVNGKFVANPSALEQEQSDMKVTVSGSANGLLMVEGETQFVSEADVLSALKFAYESMKPMIKAQNELREKVGRPKRAFSPTPIDSDFKSQVLSFVDPKIKAALLIREKMGRYDAFTKTKEEAKEKFVTSVQDKEKQEKLSKHLSFLVEDSKYRMARQMILKDKSRIDGRDMTTVRPISCEVALLPRVHGSGLFTRGETQVMSVVTLGTGDDEQMVDTLGGMVKKRFMLHYNFPPYSVGEVGRMGSQSRREVGHGSLAQRALSSVLPPTEKFPYTIRLVGEVLESNGSSSMGTVCSGTLALLDAGVPIKKNIAGIAMGLIKEGSDVAVLTDILGDEDHLGDMDFKVAGSRDGVTALQMDIKIDSVSFEVMEKALQQAKEGRLHILSKMEEVMSTPRGQISEYAPRIETIKVRPEKVREIIGAGGKVIKGIIEQTGVKIDIEDDGTVNIASADPANTRRAIAMIEAICAEAEIGKIYTGKVKKITDFGAFVEVLPNVDGLLHISEIAHERLRSVTDALSEGDVIEVKVLDVDRNGKIKLSRKVLLDPPARQ